MESLTSETTEVWANADGTMSAEVHAGQVRVRDGRGGWAKVDLNLRRRPDGSVAPGMHPEGLVLTGAVGAGEHDLAVLGSADERVAVGWRGVLPDPVLDGTKATYVDVKPGIDLVIETTRSGFETFLVVKNRAAAARVASVAMPLRTGTLTTQPGAGGGFDLRDRAGKVRGRVSAAFMWDARVNLTSGLPTRRVPVALSTRSAGAGRTDLVLTPDVAFLEDPTTVYPVTIDPQLNIGTTGDTYVESDIPNTSKWSSTELLLGTYNDGGVVARSFLRFDLTPYYGTAVNSATLRLWETWAWSCFDAEWRAYVAGYVDQTTTWNTQPSMTTHVGTSSQTTGRDECEPDGWVAIDARGFFQAAADAQYPYYSLGLRATQEGNNGSTRDSWKRFHSANGVNDPYVTINYTGYPTVGTRSTAPSTICATGSSRPYINTATPTLKAQISDPEGASVKAEFEWWAVGGASKIGSAVTGTAPSGSTLQAAVTGGAFANGSNYMWRVRGNDGVVNGSWSSWCEFTIDTTVPAAPPTVSSSVYPEGAWAGGAGTPGDFTLSASGVSDVASYLYGLDTNPPTTSVAAPSLGAAATVSITPPTNLPHTLYVQSVDRAGNTSPLRSYAFSVGSGAGTVLLPRTGDMSAARFALQAQGQSGATGVTYQWRRGDADAWTTIPAGDVTVAAGGGAVTWPQATSGGGAFAKLNWDVAATLNNAEAGLDPLDGPLQVRGSFTGAGSYSDAVDVTFDLNRAWAASSEVGPGSVNLLTGNYSLGQTDVAVYGLGLSRVYNTRQAGAVDAMFGPGWVSSAATTANPGYTDLTVIGSLVQIGLPDGSTLGFTQHDASNTTFDPQVGFEAYTLTRAGTPAAYTLKDPTGNTVVFTQPAGAATGVYSPSSATPVGTADTFTVSWQLVPGSTTQARPTRILAPVPVGVSCDPTLVAGCRALTFTYATTTTATGTDPGGWGDFAGRVIKVEFTAFDPDLVPTPGMRTIEVSRYTYDSAGRLRAAWDPRLDWVDTSETPHVTRQVQTVYGYNGDGILSSITPPGQEPWVLAYTTVPADAGTGRLASVTRSALAAGTTVSTVVYRVPVSGTGAPHDLSATQTARWGQTEAPTDAAALFPPTQIPNGNQATGTLPTSYEYASVTYLDANGRTVNTAAPGGSIDTTWLDPYGNTIQTLTAGNRKRALDASATDPPSQEAAHAATLSTIDTYSADGQRLVDSLGPEYDVMLASGSPVRGRSHTTYAYDQGAPPTGGPYNLGTTTTNTVRYLAGGAPVDADARTTTTGYDWTLRAPTVQTVDPSGLALTTRTTYDTAGRVVTITAPAGGATTDTPSTRKITYYSAAPNSTHPACGSKPAWDGLACRTEPGGQPGTDPELPYTVTTYDIYGQPRTIAESTSAGELRRITVSYDTAGRPYEAALTAAGLGAAVPGTRTIYDKGTGQAIKTQSLDGSGAMTAEIVRGYDTLGRLTSYTDADANTSTTTYDLASRVATTNDGKATRTYTYDGGTERRGLPTHVADTGAGTFTASYDTDANPVSQTWPNGVNLATVLNEVGVATSVTYTQPGCGQPDCTIYSENVTLDAADAWLNRTSTLSAQTYNYDKARRLTQVNDTVGGQCITRTYTFTGTSGKASNRTNLTTYNPNPDGTCQTIVAASSRSYTYDGADRITTTGITYDALGRALTTPAADTALPANGDATMTYHTNDMARIISQNARNATYTLDVIANRYRSWTDNATGTTITKTHHYTSDIDSPAWTDEGNGTWTRAVTAVGGLAAIQTGPAAGNLVWQISNLHGDLVAGMVDGAPGLAYTSEHTEFGQPRNTTDIGSRRYGWLGAMQRASDTPGGTTLMGARLYTSSLGRFLSTDPIYGGSANAYEYCVGDPIQCVDPAGLYWYSNCWDGRDRCSIWVYLNRWQSFLAKVWTFGFLFTVMYAIFATGVTAGFVGFMAFTVGFAVAIAAGKVYELILQWHRCIYIRYDLQRRRYWWWPRSRYALVGVWGGLYNC